MSLFSKSDDFPVPDGEFVRFGLQELRRRFQGHGPHRECCLIRRISGHDRDTRRVSPIAEIDAIGTAADHPDLPVIDAQCLGANLGQRRFHALADGGGAGDQLYSAVGVHGDANAIRGGEAAFLDKKCQSDADAFTGGASRGQFRLCFLPTGKREAFVQRAQIIAGIQQDFVVQGFNRTTIGHFLPGQKIATTQFERVEIEFGGEGIHEALANKGALVAARRSVGADRCLVAQANMACNAKGRHAVGTGEHARGQVRRAHAVSADIGALIVKEHGIDRQQPPIFTGGDAGAVKLLARV